MCLRLPRLLHPGKVVRVSGISEVQALPYVHRNQLGKIRVGLENKAGHSDKTSRIALIVSAPNRETFDQRAALIRETLQVDTDTGYGIKPLIWE